MTEAFIPPTAARYSKLSDAQGPALFTPLDRPEDLMFVGTSDTPYAVFLGGKYAGECFQLKLSENWEGMLIEQVRIEVDPNSAYSPDTDGKKALTIIRRGDAVGIMATLKERGGFAQKVTVLASDAPEDVSALRLGFTRWRISIGDGGDRVTLWEITSEER